MLVYRKKNQKYAQTIPFRNQHQDKVKIFAVFFDRMLSERVQSEEYICGILSKKIASKGVWGNGRFPQLNIPSALAVAKQVYRFLFADWGFSDCFPGKVDARYMKER